MRYFFTFFISFLLIACERSYNDNPSGFWDFVDFPEAPIEIMSNLDESSSEYDCRIINYFNIIQVRNDLYYMYYAAMGVNSGEKDIDQGLFFAYSTDAIHWARKLPTGSGNLLIENGIQEQYVFVLDSDIEFPYRLIANIKEENKFKLCMWKSKNGYDFNFDEKNVLLSDRLHDTQNVMIPRKNSLYLYTRLWNKEGTNRLNGIARFDLQGNLESVIDTLAGDYLYNSAASYVNEQYDLLLPTYMNNRDGNNKSDVAYVKAYYNAGKDCTEIDTNFNKWLKDDEKWMIVVPGIIDVNGKKYIAYNTRTWSHDTKQPVGGVSRYYLIPINLYIKGQRII
jgi:hypothetical protein